MPRLFMLDNGETEPAPYAPPTTGTASGLPVLSWDQAALQLGRTGASWAPTLGTPVTVTYAFRASASQQYMDTYLAGLGEFAQFSAAQIAVTEAVLQLWADVANISFVRVGTGTTGPGAYSNDATMLFGNFANGPDQFSAFAFLPSPNPNTRLPDAPHGDLWFNTQRATVQNPADPQIGGARLLSHEIGHTLGLLHPGEYDGGANSGLTYINDADHWQDSAMFTNMSYFGETNTGALYGAAAWTPLLHDIAAAQRIYGANMTTRTGDTVYGFNSTAGRAALLISSAGEAKTFAIWDAGGIDTLDLSGYATASEIDLREEAFSSAGPGAGGSAARYNISIARGAIIENAIGGAGNDTIIGNAYANTLRGNNGADVISGGGGADYLDGGLGSDTLNGDGGDDFIVWDAGDVAANINGGAGTDMLVFTSGAAPTSFNLALRGFEGAEGRFVDTGGNAWTTETSYYGVAWQRLRTDIAYDDGTSVQLYEDTTNAHDWSINWHHFNAAGQEDINSLNYDNGLSDVLYFDPSDSANWQLNWNRFNVDMEALINTVTYDDDTVEILYNDVDDLEDWAVSWNQLNAGGETLINTVTFDHGGSEVVYYDPSDTQAWQTNWNRYDSLGRLDLNAVTSDDGSYVVLDYDQGDAFAWETIWRQYNSSGVLLNEVVTPDGP